MTKAQVLTVLASVLVGVGAGYAIGRPVVVLPTDAVCLCVGPAAPRASAPATEAPKTWETPA